MRLWSLHPKYLDARGLVALWREALLAQAVLRGLSSGYRRHPQLERFQSQADPLSAIAAYLNAVHDEACARGYSFDKDKVGRVKKCHAIPVNCGQIEYEWGHLMAKLAARSPDLYHKWHAAKSPDCHPLFKVRPGGVEGWERVRYEG